MGFKSQKMITPYMPIKDTSNLTKKYFYHNNAKVFELTFRCRPPSTPCCIRQPSCAIACNETRLLRQRTYALVCNNNKLMRMRKGAKAKIDLTLLMCSRVEISFRHLFMSVSTCDKTLTTNNPQQALSYALFHATTY